MPKKIIISWITSFYRDRFKELKMGVAREEQFLNLSNKVGLLITNNGSGSFKGCSLHLVRLQWFLPTNAIKNGIST